MNLGYCPASIFDRLLTPETGNVQEWWPPTAAEFAASDARLEARATGRSVPADEWCSWVNEHGVVGHHPASGEMGRWITAQMIAADEAALITCSAPKALVRGRCGERFRPTRKSQKFCSKTCAKRAERKARSKGVGV